MSLGINLGLLIGPTIPLPAPLSIIDSIQSVEVTNTDEGRDGFQIVFSVGRGGLAGGGGQADSILDYGLVSNPLLKQFNRIIIMITFEAFPKVLVDGIITHRQLNPSNEPGESTLIITGEDVSIMMDLEEKSETHPNQPDMLIVHKIILSYAQYGLVPVVKPPISVDVPLIVDRIPTQQSTDLEYIVNLARSHDHIFCIEPTAPGINAAYWGPLDLIGLPQKALSINMGPDTNVSSINFQYNALKPILVNGSVMDRTTNATMPVRTFASLRPPLSSQPAVLVNQPNVRTKKFRSSGVNALQAFSIAQSETDRSMDVLTVTGEMDGLIYGNVLRARKLVGVRGAGYGHDGFYYVKNVTHKIMIGSYKQTFTLTREGLGSLTPLVQP